MTREPAEEMTVEEYRARYGKRPPSPRTTLPERPKRRKARTDTGAAPNVAQEPAQRPTRPSPDQHMIALQEAGWSPRWNDDGWRARRWATGEVVGPVATVRELARECGV